MLMRNNQQKIVLVSKDLSDAQFKCIECQKVFISAIHVERHFVRRHGLISRISEQYENCYTSSGKIIEVAGRLENLLGVIEVKAKTANFDKCDKACATETAEEQKKATAQPDVRKAVKMFTLPHGSLDLTDPETSQGNWINVERNCLAEAHMVTIDCPKNPEIQTDCADENCLDKTKMPNKLESAVADEIPQSDEISKLQPLLATLIEKLQQKPVDPKCLVDSGCQTDKKSEELQKPASSSQLFNLDEKKSNISDTDENSESETSDDDDGRGTLETKITTKSKSENLNDALNENDFPDIFGRSETTKHDSPPIKSENAGTGSADFETTRRQILISLEMYENELANENNAKTRKLTIDDVSKRLKEILTSKREMKMSDDNGVPMAPPCDMQERDMSNLKRPTGTVFEEYSEEENRCNDGARSDQHESPETELRDALKTNENIPKKRKETKFKTDDSEFQFELSECQHLIGELANDLKRWKKSKKDKLNDSVRAQIEEKLTLNLVLLGIDKDKWKLSDSEAAVANFVLNRKKLRSTKRTSSVLFDELRAAYAEEIDRIARSKLEYPF